MRKKTLSVLFFAVCSLLLSAADAFCTPKQLSLADVETLLRNGVSNERIAEIVRTHGVAFDLKESEAKKLKSLGADKRLIDTIRQARSKKPPSGSLFVSSQPSEAEVFLNGVSAGKTPLRIERLDPGPVELRIGKVEGYDDYVTIVEIKPKTTLVFEATLGRLLREAPPPAPETGQRPAQTSHLVIDTAPEGAKVYIDGAYRGTSPATIELDPGRHVVLVIKESFRPHTETITLEEGTRFLSVRLKPR